MFKYIKNILSQKCPRCYQGKMFTHKWYQLKYMGNMVQKCEVCGQRTELETGFYYGTGYVSYALSVAVSVTTFVASWVLFDVGFSNNNIYWWLGINTVLLILLQPVFMRLSRVLWLSWFFHQDDAMHHVNCKA